MEISFTQMVSMGVLTFGVFATVFAAITYSNNYKKKK